MSEVRCPMCGKSNPADADVCQFCEARLKPLFINPEGDKPDEIRSPDRLDDLLDSLPEDDQASRENGPEQAARKPDSTPPFVEDKEGQNDWLSDLRGEGETAPFEMGAEDQAWLEDIRTGSLRESQVDFEAEDEPEWLRRIRARQREEASQAAPDENGEDDFLSRLRSDSSPDEPASDEHAPELPFSQDDELKDWLTNLDAENENEIQAPRGEISTGGTEPFSEPTDLPSEEIPEWLQEIIDQKAPEESEPDRQLEAESEADKAEPEPEPGWSEFLKSKGDAFKEEETADTVDVHSGEVPPADEDTELDAEIKALLESDRGPETQLPPELFTEGSPLDKDREAVDSNETENPEWLDENGSEEHGSQIPDKEGLENLAPAELPRWLEAMRPVESAARPSLPETTGEGDVEQKGPLAGLRGVLSVEPEASRLHNAGSFSLKMRITEEQQRHTNLFSEQIKLEGVVKPLPGAPVLTPQNFLRIVIFIVLVAVILWPLLLNSQQMPPPDFPQALLDANMYVGAVPPSAPVLIGVDYDPGLAAEMERAASPVIDHLMIYGAYLTLVSTVPTGPVQAEQLIQNINMRYGHTYLNETQYTNLGYLAGEAMGLLSFAQSPRLARPVNAAGEQAWVQRSIQEIEYLDQFALALVISDSPDKARLWIEQVAPYLPDTPMVMVLSAQAEPIVRPYFAARPQQVQGFITGLSGGAAYETLMQRPGLATRSWDAFSLGILAAVVLMIGGASYNLVAESWTTRRHTRQSKAKES